MNLCAVGKVVGIFGIQGYLKILPTTHSLQRFKNLLHVYVGASEEKVIPCTVENVILTNKSLLVKLEEICSRDEATKIKDQFIFVSEKDIVKPKKSEYFIHDIIGCKVWSTESILIGTVEDVYKMKAQDIWAIRKADKVYLLPAVKEFVKSVDVRKKKIIVKLIEGLIEE